MNLTEEERARRAERSRRNGACSRGPTSTAGRERVKLNALSDGLTAKTFPLPFEREEAEQRTQKWQTYYHSDSPASVHLANECARATIVADRCQRFREARCARQVENTQRNWNRRRRRRVETVVERGRKSGGDRLAALGELGTFAHGCRFVARELGLIIDALQTRGYLEPEEIETAIFYQGIWPVAAALATNDTAYTLHTLNLAVTPGLIPEQLDAWLAPVNRPEGLRALPRDEKDARKLRTSHGEARTSFHRALKDLYQTLDRDRAGSDENDDCNGGAGSDGAGRRDGPHPPFGHPLPGGEGKRRDDPHPAFGHPLPGGEGGAVAPAVAGAGTEIKNEPGIPARFKVG
jgi:hypothetical protein